MNDDTDDTMKDLGQRMVEVEARREAEMKLKPAGWPAPGNRLDRHRERDERGDSLNDKLDRLEVLLEELLRRIG